MIVVNVTVTSTDSDIAALRAAINELERATREESGCLDYTFSVELNNPHVLRITEKWESVDALKAHFASAHMAESRKAFAQHPPAAMDAKFYRVEEFDPF